MFEIDENNLPFVRTRQALLLLDLQNDFVGEKSLLPVESPPDYLENIKNLAGRFRVSGDVIWIRSVFPEGKSRVVNQERSDSENIITDNELPKLQRHSKHIEPLAEDKAEEAKKKNPNLSTDDEISESFLTVEPGEKAYMVQADSPGSDFADSIKPYVFAKDMIFPKTYYSAFRDGNLVQTLRGKFVTEIYICGVLTNVSVFATAMDAARHGYAITIVDDCLGYRSKARHEEALRQLKVYTGCDVISSVDLIESFQKQKKAAERRSASSKKPRPKPKETRPEASRKTGIESLMGNLKLEAEGPQATLTSSTKATASDDEFEITSQLLRAHVRRAKPPAEIEAEVKKRERVKAKVKTRRRPSNAATENSGESSSTVSSSSKEERIKPSESPTAKQAAATKAPGKVLEKTLPKDSVINRTYEKSIDLNEQALAVLGGICEGDTTVIENLLPEGLASGIFEKIRDEVLWQKMAHQGGEVPRLIAVQGKIEEDGSIPIYRHPADESPPLSPFSPTVLTIRSEVEKKLGHPVNHVLIQFYRNGTDNISEHSDKTLDIVPNTFIANVSLGAQRTMVFRTKKPLKSLNSTKDDDTPRESCRAPLPHNSLCRMGLETNKKWLHGIRPDKRMEREKSEAELAFDGGRISLTFRHIGTYLDKTQLKIWGQGATAKRKEDAAAVINGNTQEAKDMLQAFGRENHDSSFDWKESYGKGFDVLHISNDKKLFLSGDFITDLRVKFMLNEYQVSWIEGKLSPALKWDDLNSKVTGSPVREILPIKFVDNDVSRTTVEGGLAVMLYIHAAYGPKQDHKALAYLGRQYTRFEESNALLKTWRTVPFSAKDFRSELAKWEAYANEEGAYIAGDEIGLADFAVVPMLDVVSKDWVDGERIQNLADYWQRLMRRDSVVKSLTEKEVLDTETRIKFYLLQKEMRALQGAVEEGSGERNVMGKAREDKGKEKDMEELMDGVAKL